MTAKHNGPVKLNEPHMQTIGGLLRHMRLEQRIDLATITVLTRIDAKFLRAIDADDIKSLPGSFYYKSFVRQYARCLVLDTKAIDGEVDRVLSAQATFPLPVIVRSLQGNQFKVARRPGISPSLRLSLFWRLAFEWIRGNTR